MNSTSSETAPNGENHHGNNNVHQSLSPNDPVLARNVSVVEGSAPPSDIRRPNVTSVQPMDATTDHGDGGDRITAGGVARENDSGEDVGPTEIPAEDDDVAAPFKGPSSYTSSGAAKPADAKESDGDAIGVNNGDDEGNEECDDRQDDESDYSYEYEEEEETHFAGFLIPTEFERPAASAASNDGNVNVVAASDNETCAKNVSRATSTVSSPDEAKESAAMRTSAAALAAASGTSDAPPSPKERNQKWKEPTQAAINMSLRAEKEKTGGRRRLASDLYKIMLADTSEAGFSLEPCDEDTMDKWTIKLFGFDEDSNLAKDLVVIGMDHVELEMSFPDQYPFEPPFVRVVKPRFKKQTGFVMSGALCMELLTKDGWNPINDIESVIVSIRSLMVVGDGRLQAAVELGTEQYNLVLAAQLEKKRAAAAGTATLAKGEQTQKDGEDSSMDSAKRKRDAIANDVNADLKEAKKVAVRVKTKALNAGSYTAQEASQAYDHLTKFHESNGWDKSGWWAKKG
mmetsp:Transcript_17990/g.36823  ORF Transcript_17990/g.36823 Transcript_17990/m.36823 type:complete len:514 (+) Transcript_17990:179-1720(+)